ncbi:MAG TPA: saccharopine dehydrogenase NADP-binding domain-containing protein [Azonexus sp.]|nr:saccharopine dehydrogenase NADP-binding domain-containing protein [Azonexus sp.]
MTAASTHLDLIVFGATGFVGQILARHLFEQFGAHGDLKWAAAGRSVSRLEELRASLGPKAAKLPVLVADAADETALRRMCLGAKAVVSTVGPYALYGEPLVKVCAETGTDYCDLTGEAQWIRRMLSRYEETARKSGARIVHACGFDSIPSDLGVLFLQQEAIRRFGQPCPSVKMRVKAMRGGLSGGTVASIMNVLKEAAADPQLRSELANPYSLCPGGYAPPIRQPDIRSAEYDSDFKAWVAPFIMSAINTRIVQRTNALTKQAYGADFRYDEAMLTGHGLKGRMTALGIAAGISGFMVAGAIGPARWALERFVLPAPGSGPSPQAQQQGFYDLRFIGRTDDGRSLMVKVTGDRDAGYGSTSKMLAQAAAFLARDLPKAEKPGGFWTPATLFGDRLIERLEKHSGIAFTVIDGGN